MSKIIALANQKGGIGKTTTATALAHGFGKRGFSTLLIDSDPQCSASDTYEAQIEDVATLYDVLLEGEPIKEAIQHKAIGDILPSDTLLIEAERRMTDIGREYKLKKALVPILGEYDYIIIDTPPALNILLVNALTCADIVIIPITTDRYGLQGLAQLNDTINTIKEIANPNLNVAGLLIIKYENRTNLSKDTFAELPNIAKKLNTTVFDTKIRESVSAREAQALRDSLFIHAPNSTPAIDYMAFIDELLEKGI